MKICVFGAGAIGGHMAANLAKARLDVSLVARGAHLSAIREKGLRFVSAEDDFVVRVPAVDDARELGPQDVIIITLKAHALPHAVDSLKSLLHERTAVVFATNGIPWWYFYGSQSSGKTLARLDPAGRLWNELGVARAIGCVISSPNEVVSPGVVRSIRSTNTFVLGEPDGSASERLGQIAATLKRGLPGISTTTDIRSVIWNKLMLNVAGSPLSVLTAAPWFDFTGNEEMTTLFKKLFAEVQGVASRQSVELSVSADYLLRLMGEVRHTPSMLQDVVMGREVEVDAILRSVQDLAGISNLATPILDTVTALVAQRAVVARATVLQ